MAIKTAFSRDEIAHLAYLSWKKDGCPLGRDLDYWLETECQLKATWNLLMAASAACDAAEMLREIVLHNLAGLTTVDLEVGSGGKTKGRSGA
jgi:hypothetical protein